MSALTAIAALPVSAAVIFALLRTRLATAIAVLWLVGMTNAFNLLDNMDALAATLGAVAAAYFAVDAAVVDENSTILVLSLSLLFACLGFLPFNLGRRRSAVFMGDSGSQVLGFALAAFALASSWTAAGATVATTRPTGWFTVACPS